MYTQNPNNTLNPNNTFQAPINTFVATAAVPSAAQQVRVTSDEVAKIAVELASRLGDLRGKLLGERPECNETRPGKPTGSGFLGEMQSRFYDVRETLALCHGIVDELQHATA